MAEPTRQINITPEEIEAGKTMAFVAYLIFFVPLLMEDMRKNKFVMFNPDWSGAIVAENGLFCPINVTKLSWASKYA